MMRATMLCLLMTVGCGGVELSEDAAQPTTVKASMKQAGTECLAVFSSGGCTCTYTQGTSTEDSCGCCQTACRGEVNYGDCGTPIPLD
jgi:hypothetical protein